MKDYTKDSVDNALRMAVERRELRAVEAGYTGHAQARLYFDITSNAWTTRRCSLDEAHAVLFGLASMRSMRER